MSENNFVFILSKIKQSYLFTLQELHKIMSIKNSNYLTMQIHQMSELYKFVRTGLGQFVDSSYNCLTSFQS